MKKSQALIKTIVLAMLVAIGVVISPILRVEGMCPMAHVINIICSVFLGPWYSLLCATLIGIIRMITMSIPPIALTGAVFGAFLSGVFYRMSKGKIIFAVLGEIKHSYHTRLMKEASVHILEVNEELVNDISVNSRLLAKNNVV